MKLFLDSGNIGLIEEYSYIVDGVTTNPSLIAKEIDGSDLRSMYKRICDIVSGPVSFEVISQDVQQIVDEAVSLSSIADNVVVKVPMTQSGLKAIQILAKNGIKTNVTLVFSLNQALLAAKAGASYVSIFIGRLDDLGCSGMTVVKNTADMFNRYNFKAEIIAASIRHPMHVSDAALNGSHIATVPPNVLAMMFNHNLTNSGLKKFMDDWNQAIQTNL